MRDVRAAAVYTLSLHDALPISRRRRALPCPLPLHGSRPISCSCTGRRTVATRVAGARSEEHTSELQSRETLVCRLMLEKKRRTLVLTLIFVVALVAANVLSAAP